MGHFAKVVDGKVVQVIVAEPEFFESFVDSSPGEWIQTSYNTHGGKHYDPGTNLPDDGEPLRKNYAGIGYTYDAQRDAFIPPQTYPSWTLNEESCLWEAPVPMPTDAGEKNYYLWDEENQKWDLIPVENI